MKTNKKLRKMNVTMTAYLSIALVSAIVLLSVFFFYSASALLINDAKEQTSEAVSQSGEYIESYLARVKSLTDIIAMHPDTVLYLENTDENAKGPVDALLNLAYTSDEKILSIALVSRDGSMTTVGTKMEMKTSEDMMNEQWYMEAKNSHQMPALNNTRRTAFNMEKDTWVVSISREIVTANNEHLGVLLMDIDYNFFEDYIKNIPLGKIGYAFIIDVNGQVIYHPDATYFMDEARTKELITICEAGQGTKTQEGLVTFKTNIEHSEWLLVGLSSLDNVSTLRNELLFSLALVGSIGLILSLIGGSVIARRMTSPLEELKEAMLTVGDDWKQVNISEKGSSELVVLTEHYNNMIKKIKTLLETIQKNEKDMHHFELKALQSQINPHFLYNTLETIIWLAEFQDHEKVIHVTKSLSSLLRVALKEDDGIIELNEEIAHVKSYLEIQNERYAGMLKYEINILPKFKHYKLPKLIIQPIVENAIYHGIREKGYGTVKIITEEKEDRLIIRVCDDGIGFNHSKQEQTTRLGGVGMKNVDQRIKLTFGQAYGLVTKQKMTQGSEVQFVLPLESI